MNTLRLRIGLLLSIGVLAGSACAAPPAAANAPSEEDAAMAQRVERDLGLVFIMPPDIKLDPGLRTEADAIAAAHLTRMHALVPGWIEEERRLQAGPDGKAPSAPVYYAVYARMLNELALWQLAPGDAAYEKATLDAIQATPAVCANAGHDRHHDFLTRIVRVQAMPPQARAAALATERRLLEAWGKPHPAPPPWPNPLPQEVAMEAVAQMRSGGARPPLALSPVLASILLAERERYDSMPWPTRCAFQRWWLGVSLAQGRPAAEALTAFRYGTLITASERFGDAFEREAGSTAAKPRTAATAAPPSYPKMAARFDVTGVTRVTRRFDAAGKPVQASVIERRIQVRGIRGVRPVAFEDTFDALALRYALGGASVASSESGPAQTFEMKWDLEPSTGGAATQGGKP